VGGRERVGREGREGWGGGKREEVGWRKVDGREGEEEREGGEGDRECSGVIPSLSTGSDM
jgi:hypothetical protein